MTIWTLKALARAGYILLDDHNQQKRGPKPVVPQQRQKSPEATALQNLAYYLLILASIAIVGYGMLVAAAALSALTALGDAC